MTSRQATQPHPSLSLLFRVWLALGVLSFGGGVATLALIRRAVVERHRWMTDADFVRDWALCRVAPGMNLLALTILIGRRLGGAAGIALSLSGLLLPSVTITVLLTAFYVHFQTLAVVRAALRGVIPATVGLGLMTAAQMARPLLAACRHEGKGALAVSVALLAGAAVAVAARQSSVVPALCAAGALGALAHWTHERGRP